uniref:Uncharacterized protein n=1 Tax=Branchiostoma floridae TaxID=7739 RepID=C3YCC8_BRAFL|eukprot:XP_002605955.1 hypothetical protein BRAFLDRAFT_92217 [Branchiostoma floridae]
MRASQRQEALRRSASLPVVTRYTNRTAEEDTASCKSLPAVLFSNDPSYSEIPDNVAAAQRPLPAIPQIYSVIPDAIAAAEQPLDLYAQPHIYSHIQDDDDDMGPIPFYAAAADMSLGTDTAYGVSCESNQVVCSPHSVAARETAVHGAVIEAIDHHVKLYGKEPNAIRQQRYRAHGLGGSSNTPRPACLPLTVPYTDLSSNIPGKGTRNTQRYVSLPLTPQNTIWPCKIPGEGIRNTQRYVSLTLSLPNTYWPWKIPEQITHNTPRRESLALVTLPNTYWPWETPGEATRNIPRRASLYALPNTYWPWKIPGEDIPVGNTPRCAYIPLVTPPNTY